MNIKWFFILHFLSGFFISVVNAALDPSSLIKVSPENNPKCIEYYHYQNSLYCSTVVMEKTSKVDPAIHQYETQKIVFDKRPWQAVWGKKTAQITTVEYIPAGDNIEQWQELITSQFIPKTQNKMTALEFSHKMLENLKKSGLQPKITIIESRPDYVLFEFQIVAPENLKQDEIQQIINSNDGIYILHYVVKKSDMGEENRATWIKNIKQAQPLYSN